MPVACRNAVPAKLLAKVVGAAERATGTVRLRAKVAGADGKTLGKRPVTTARRTQHRTENRRDNRNQYQAVPPEEKVRRGKTRHAHLPERTPVGGRRLV
ncbi:hypothetical protein [Streptomyces natalensis]|uniref:hypothetical protein n=1 Tax=Streptomyces natalensis TaxID=68242 RepID=UPI0012FEB7BA|nr:hypothetical protein [Streptomyces natalensis]